eukprot:Platyproteum_vivax@DN7609_c3_g1_i11.p1
MTAGATQVLKIGMQHRTRFLDGDVGFNVTFPGEWKIDCDPTFNGPDIIEQNVTYVGLERPTYVVCDRSAQANKTDIVVKMKFRDLFPEPTPNNGLYFSIAVTFPKEVEPVIDLVHRLWIQYYTENEAFYFAALKQQGSYFQDHGIRIYATDSGTPIVRPPELSTGVELRSGDACHWGFSIDIKKMVNGVPGGILRVFAPNFDIFQGPRSNLRVSLLRCEPGDKLKPDWVTDDMDLARHVDRIRHPETTWEIPLPATMAEFPEKFFFSMDTSAREQFPRITD